MLSGLDNKRDSASIRKNLLESLLNESQQPTQPLLNQLIEYYFQTEASNAILLIKQFNEAGKEQSKVLIEHLNLQGLKQINRNSASNESHLNDDKEKVAHTMKVFRILCLIIHSQVPGLSAYMKDNVLLTNCINAIAKHKEDPNILAQGCYFFAALTATLPSEIVQHTDPIINIFKSTCKYLLKHSTSLRQLSIQTNPHSLENVQLWIVNQAAHALFYTLYTAYPCNFLYHIQREFQRHENYDVFEHIFIPMFQRVRLNRRLIDNDRKRELDKDKRLRQDSFDIIYEARKLSLDPLFGRESPSNSNWMHQEMKKILPFYQFKRQSPIKSSDLSSEVLRKAIDMSTPPEMASKRVNSSPFQRIKEKIKSFVRPGSSSTPTTTISTPDTSTASTSNHNNNNNNNLSIPNVSSIVLSSPSPALGSDMRTVKTMPELQSNTDSQTSSSSGININRSDEERQIYIRSVIDTISTIYDQNLPTHWRKLLSQYDSSLLVVSTSQRQATFYVSPSEHSLDNQQHHLYDDSSPTSTNEKRERCVSASCTTHSHIHSPVLAAPTTSTDDILTRTQSLSTKQRVRHGGVGQFSRRSLIEQSHYEENDNDDNVLVDEHSLIDSRSMNIPSELYMNSETKAHLIDEIVWNDHDFISIPHFDFNDIVTNNCSSDELQQFDRLYECYSSYEIFLTEQYKKFWENLQTKQKMYLKHYNDFQATRAFTKTLEREIHVDYPNELKTYENESKCLSDENTLLGDRVVELGKVKTRSKQIEKDEEKCIEIRNQEIECEKLRKIVNNETLKLDNLHRELNDNENEARLMEERLEQTRNLAQNAIYIHELNQELECQYLRFTDDMSKAMHSHMLSTPNLKDENTDEQQPFILTSSVNGCDEISEMDTNSLNDENREDIYDIQQQDDEPLENFNSLLADLIQMLTNQNIETDLTPFDIEDRAYSILLDYMESKANMQSYLIEHNSCYSDLYLKIQHDFIVQLENELASKQSHLEKMQSAAI